MRFQTLYSKVVPFVLVLILLATVASVPLLQTNKANSTEFNYAEFVYAPNLPIKTIADLTQKKTIDTIRKDLGMDTAALVYLGQSGINNEVTLTYEDTINKIRLYAITKDFNGFTVLATSSYGDYIKSKKLTKVTPKADFANQVIKPIYKTYTTALITIIAGLLSFLALVVVHIKFRKELKQISN